MTATTNALAVSALEIIAGERPCVDNLLSDKDVARQALAAIREALVDQPNTKGESNVERTVVGLTEPVKQEPVAWALSHSLGLEFSSKFPMCESKERAEEFARQHLGQVVVTPLYAAPVDAKAIRTAALDEALEIALTVGGDFAVRFRVALESIR